MSTNPFGCNKRNSFNSFSTNKAEKKIVPEPVTLIAAKSQVITLNIPFNTPAAQSIRTYMHTHCVSDGVPAQKLFIYRSANGWTNIALDSTEQSPKLTADVYYTLKTAWRTFNDCSHVSNLTMRNEDGSTFEYDDIDKMEFIPLPDKVDVVQHGEASRTDAEVILEMIEKVHKKQSEMDGKLDAILAANQTLPRVVSNPTDPIQIEPVTEKATRKRPAS
jgi:hypothetical protein